MAPACPLVAVGYPSPGPESDWMAPPHRLILVASEMEVQPPLL